MIGPFFKKQSKFPRLFIAIRLFNIGFLWLDNIATVLMFQDISLMDGQTVASLIKSTVFSFAWIMYVRRSERVKVTFVNDSGEGKVL